MASKRHSNPTTARCKAPSPKQIDWHCHHCRRPTADGFIAVSHRNIRKLTADQVERIVWRVTCRPCTQATHGSLRDFRKTHHYIPVERMGSPEAIDLETLRLFRGTAVEWAWNTNWADITTVGGTEKAAAA